ncbi:arginine--tRNA ligase [Patescibacteria group bacterium]|nr:arginine--tRNA ligase [Patescibacteria group bacterium]
MIRERIREKIQKIAPRGVDFSIERPERSEFGDYSSNIALVAAKKMGKNPLEVAKEMKSNLEKAKMNGVERIEVADPGFINFYLSDKVFIENIVNILNAKEKYGSNETLKGKKIMIEYTDPNPFKEFHIGHLMSNSIGEALSRIIEFSGAEVKRANYQGDAGIHVAKAIWGMMHMKENLTTDFLGRAYVKGDRAYEEDEAARKEITEINKKIFDRSDSQINQLYDRGRKLSLDQFEKIYQRLGTKFDYYFFESETGKRGEKIVEEGLKKDMFEKSEGAVVFRGEKAGLHTRVFINSEGLPTYEAKELGLALIKQEKYPHDFSFVVTGNEITEYYKVVLEALKQLYPDIAQKIKHIPHGMLRLPTGKMSSRKGEAITADSLLDELKASALKKMQESETIVAQEQEAVADRIAVGAIKYSILKQSIGKDIIFDFETSLSFEGDSGPYLQYTHARACSVLKKAGEATITASTKTVPEKVTEIEKLLYAFPEVVERANTEYAPNHIATFLINLARAFNHFYARERIIDSGDAAPYRVALTQAVSITMKNGLWLLGISAPERM